MFLGIVFIFKFNFKDLNCKSGFDYKSLVIGIVVLFLIISGILVIVYYFCFEIFLLIKCLYVVRKYIG